jgi:hypothetical protein
MLQEPSKDKICSESKGRRMKNLRPDHETVEARFPFKPGNSHNDKASQQDVMARRCMSGHKAGKHALTMIAQCQLYEARRS